MSTIPYFKLGLTTIGKDIYFPIPTKWHLGDVETVSNLETVTKTVHIGKRKMLLRQGSSRTYKCVKHWFLIFSWYSWELVSSKCPKEVLL